MKIKQLIDDCNFDWIYEPIKELMSEYDGEPVVGELHKFEKPISSEDALKELDNLGFRAGTLPELLAYQKAHPKSKEWIVALGTQFFLGGDSFVPSLGWDGDRRSLSRDWFGYEWGEYGRFLAVRKSLELNSSDFALDDLTLAIELCKKHGLIVTKVY